MAPVGPDYRQPVGNVPTQWASPLSPDLQTDATVVAAQWWQAFADPLLTELIEQARAHNLDLRQAEARICEARARRTLAQANLLPSLSANGSASTQDSSRAAGSGLSSDLFSNRLDAAWELDLFGKKRRALEAAEAAQQASVEDWRDVLVSLTAEVALNYLDLRSNQARLAVTEANLTAQNQIYDLVSWRQQAGLTTQLDVEQARLTLETTRASLPTLISAAEQAKHRLAVLLGTTPDTLKTRLDPYRSLPSPISSLVIGIPADALRQRPDVRRAERKLAAQTAQIGVAEAALYPDFKLIGSIGLESLAYSNLYTASAKTLQAAVNATWVLFDAGRIRSNIAVQTALQEQALATYEAAVLVALRDVENALVAYAQERQRRDALDTAAESGRHALQLAESQYAAGLIDFQRVLDSQRSLLTVQTQLAASQAETISNLIRLYKALGGGWPAGRDPTEPS